MPTTRRRRNAATAVVEEQAAEMDEEQRQEEDHAQDQEQSQVIARLKFKEPLSWTVGKAIPVAELLTRLEKLFKELKDYEQDFVERDSLTSVANDLVQPKLLDHRDKGVRAYTACCLVEIFRLCAPDAPFDEKQLQGIFTLIAKFVLPALADPSDPYNTQHSHVLDSLVKVKSIVLLVDISASSSLILHIFTSCFDVLSGSSKASSGEEIGKNVEFHMTALLETLIDEAQMLPDQVVEIVLAQFLRADPRVLQGSGGKGKKSSPVDSRQSTLLMKQAPPAYNMAMNICNSQPEKMGRYITQYFSSVIMNVSGAGSGLLLSKSRSKAKAKDNEETDSEETSGPSEANLKELQKAHRLARELWRATPDVLQNIVPQIEAELAAENEDIRLLATETMGDMVAGIGAAGPPSPPMLDPAAYPSQSLQISRGPTEYNFLTTPNSPHAFNTVYPTPYQTFLGRRNDKSSRIRAAWTTTIGRIILTSAGNVGLDDTDESILLQYLAAMLMDGDEKVRLSAVEAIDLFSFQDFVLKLGKAGGVAESGSILCNLSERMKDPKHVIRTEAMTLLGKIWGIAAGAIAEGNERVHQLFAPIPSRILDTLYINDSAINALVDDVLFDSLFPLQYPPLKTKQTNGTLQKSRSHINGDSQLDRQPDEAFSADKIRVERMLLLVRDLEPRAKKVFFAFQGRQTGNAKVMDAFLRKCEDYNGGVIETNEAEIKKQLRGLIDWNAKTLPDPAKAVEDLQKFAKMHDRRSYALIRFCTALESDYRKVQKAIKELTKRIEESLGSGASVLDTIKHLVWRASIIFYNISHVPAIVDFARTDEKGLSSTAHEVLKDISTQNPGIFRTHVKELCEGLIQQAPSAKQSNDPSAVDTLKACAGFARKFPQEIPNDRKFLQSMVNFALYGSPPQAAKYAVSVLMSGPKKEMHAKDLAAQCTKDFQYGSPHFVSELATLSQLIVLAPVELENDIDAIIDIAINRVLLTHQPNSDICSEKDWHVHPDRHLQARTWALKILVNRLRGLPPATTDIGEVAAPVYKLLTTLVSNDGELSKTEESPKPHRIALRLQAAQLLLKLSVHSKHLDQLLTPSSFNNLATIAQDPTEKVRDGFIRSLMKYLAVGSASKLPSRFYVPIFLLAFEPAEQLKSSAQTWLRARTAALQRARDTTMEAVFVRLLSCLSWHPDFDSEGDEILGSVPYLLFYLTSVASADNLPLIFHVAQRVKTVQDGISEDADAVGREQANERLYIVSELAQAVIRRFAEEKGWSLQAWPGKLSLPADIFARMSGHEKAQEVATKQYLAEEVGERLEGVVRVWVRGKKRKAEGRERREAKKKVKRQTEKGEKKARAVRTPQKRRRVESEDAAPSSERRRSGRTKGGTSYVEQDDSEDERDMERWNQSDDVEEDDNEDEEMEKSSNGEDREMKGEGEDGEDGETEMPDAEPETKRTSRSRTKVLANRSMANGVAQGSTGKKAAVKKGRTPIPISSDKESDTDLSDPPESEQDV
ncbi:MAG: hypothetical protein Q9157_000648 [Trypethelium eluteriae]